MFKENHVHQFKQISMVKKALESKYYERNEVILATLLTIIAGENMLLLGPPGAAKSAVLVDLCQYIRDCEYFQWVLTKRTHPDELLGPYDEKEKEYGVFKRLTKNKLPEAHIAFLDETLKAEGDTLNSLLTLLNEKTIIQKGVPEKVPLISLFGASNEYPEDAELEALYDRFLIRMKVTYITDQNNLLSLLSGHSTEVANGMESISLETVKVLKQIARNVEIDTSILRAIVEIRERLFEKKIEPSDRRLKNSLKILQAHAVLREREKVTFEDLVMLKHILWTRPADQDQVTKIIDDFM